MTGASVTAIPVSAEPSNAGRVPVNCPAGKLVRDAPLPLNTVAETVPVTVIPALLVANLSLLL